MLDFFAKKMKKLAGAESFPVVTWPSPVSIPSGCHYLGGQILYFCVPEGFCSFVALVARVRVVCELLFGWTVDSQGSDGCRSAWEADGKLAYPPLSYFHRSVLRWFCVEERKLTPAISLAIFFISSPDAFCDFRLVNNMIGGKHPFANPERHIPCGLKISIIEGGLCWRT